MSIARIALRMAVVEALRNNTLVGDNVLDSQIGAIDAGADGALRTDQDAPFLAVYTDSAKTELADTAPRQLYDNGVCDLVIEVGITAMMTEIDPDTGESQVIGLPATDAVFETTLDLIVRQVFDALLDAENPWSIVFQGLCERVVKVERARVGQATGGLRLAAQEVRITIQMTEDPPKGADLDEQSAINQFLELLEGSEDVGRVSLASRIRVLLGTGSTDWEAQRRRLGLSAAEMGALGLTPVVTDDGVPVEFSGGVIEITGSAPVAISDD